MKNQFVVATTGAFIGLLYVVFLPIIGTVAVVSILIYRFVRALRPRSRTQASPKSGRELRLRYLRDGHVTERDREAAALEASEHVKTALNGSHS